MAADESQLKTYRVARGFFRGHDASGSDRAGPNRQMEYRS
jgi:hypothetical protein